MAKWKSLEGMADKLMTKEQKAKADEIRQRPEDERDHRTKGKK